VFAYYVGLERPVTHWGGEDRALAVIRESREP
jgi:hypothetical protein